MAKGPEIWVCPQCGFRMDIAPLGLYAEVQCSRCFRTERVHAQLSNFRLDSVLGVGGMSVVYRAFDVVLHRPLALKVLSDTFRDQPERIERFENESAMMARVRHENVTSVYSAGRAYGQFYIAMELIEGTNLEYMVSADQPMDAAQALDIIRQVACGLQAANRAGLLHRDMKPGNILITPEGRAKVIDFGLAMDSREDDTEEIIWATPYYVPPETLQRQPEDVRTDIYALGMTLRFLLTGIERFDVEINSLTTLIQCKRTLVPLAKLGTALPRGLVDLVDHMTEYAPSDRPADYDELLSEIAEVQQELSTYDATKALRRSKLIRNAAVVGGISIGALLGYALAPTPPAKKRELIPLPVPTRQEVQKNEVMPPVLKMLEEKDYAKAVSTLLSASEKESDPCVGAWYAQLARTILGACYSNPAAAEVAHSLLTRHMANKARVMPSGVRTFRVFERMDSRRYPDAQSWSTGVSDWNSLTRAELDKGISDLSQDPIHPVLKVINWFVLAEKAAWLGLDDISQECLRNIKTVPSLGEYEVLSELLGSPSLHRRSGGGTSELSRALSSLREHDFATALERLTAITGDSRFNDKTRAQAQVLCEVCEVGREMFETLRRKAPARYRDGLSDEDYARMARGISAPSRSSLWVDGSQEGHPAEDAIDGRLDTRWCGTDSIGGHRISIDVDANDELSAIVLHWENTRPLQVNLRIYSEGRVIKYDYSKNTQATRYELNNRVIDRIEVLFPLTYSEDNWPGIVETQLVKRDGSILTPDRQTGRNDFADELRGVLLLLSGKYKEAIAYKDFICARQGANSPFSTLYTDWCNRLSTKDE